MSELHEYLTKAASTFRAKPVSLMVGRITVEVVVADTGTGCQEEACFAHSTCAGKIGRPPNLNGLKERQNWLVGAAMSELARQGSLPTLQGHLAFACDDFWQTRWAR